MGEIQGPLSFFEEKFKMYDAITLRAVGMERASGFVCSKRSENGCSVGAVRRDVRMGGIATL